MGLVWVWGGLFVSVKNGSEFFYERFLGGGWVVEAVTRSLLLLPASLLLVVRLLDCLVLRVGVQVPLQGPHVLVVVSGGGDDLEADVAEGVEHHDARALQADAVLRVPALLVLHVLGKLVLRGGKKEESTCTYSGNRLIGTWLIGKLG